jgi:insertion element IS1 protein InsB
VSLQLFHAFASAQASEREPVGIEAELDEMWGCVGAKETTRWLWHAIDHHTGQVWAYVLGNRVDHAFLALEALLKPFGITRDYTDRWGAYRRYLPPEQHIIGKLPIQKIERKHLTWRTRLKRLNRQALCCSRSTVMYDAVIGSFINQYEFAQAIL